MADNNKKIQQVNIINHEGDVHFGVRLAPDASDIVVKSTGNADASTKATLEEFLFSKFDDSGDIRQNVKNSDGEKVFHEVAPSSQSIWQWLTDHQDIVKKRLVGLYAPVSDENGSTVNKYTGQDFLLADEKNDDTDIQAQYTLLHDALSEGDVDLNVDKVIELFQLQDQRVVDEDGISKVKPDYRFIDGKPADEFYTPEEKARELMFAFGDKSFWQALIEREIENKKKLIGVYKDGNCIGYFEPTRYNLDAIKDAYDTGFKIETTFKDGILTQEIQRGPIETDEEALALVADLSKKSVYQQLLELKDFWITLPFEFYDDNNGNTTDGINIANKCDINKLHFAD